MIQIVRIQTVLGEAGYTSVESNNPSVYVCRSPHTGRLITVPMGAGDILPVSAVGRLLRDEPNRDQLIDQMRG